MDPLAVAARLGSRPGRVVLDSAADHDGLGRWSFVACAPERVLEVRGDTVVVRDRDGRVSARVGRPLAVLAELADELGADGPIDDGPLPVGIGYLGYDLGRRGRADERGLPDLWFGWYGAVWRGDRETGEARVVGRDPAAVRALEAMLAEPVAPAPPPRFGSLGDPIGLAHYRAAFARIQDYLAAGDVYQVNLARRLEATVLAPGDPLALYRAARAAAPSPCGALIETAAGAVVSASPELFLRRAAGAARLETRPIKGTRRRTGDLERDRALVAELIADPKELAEHLMIVDLERNDLGRIAETGSVAVEAFARVVELPTLYHLVSTVSCRVAAGIGTGQILEASFPGGSITGAPKRRAMEIIDEVEGFRRGVYTGAIGYLGGGGAIELSIAIRTATVADGRLQLAVGGGVVADSRVDRELEETEEKAAAWRTALARL